MRVKKEFIVKEDKAYRLRVEAQPCLSPKELINLDFIQECLNKDGKVDFTSTYNFHMSKDDIAELINGLEQL
jgi:hypothetical protein